MIKHMEKVTIIILMELAIRVIGSMINNMGKVLKHGLMVLNMLVLTLWDKNMAKEKIRKSKLGNNNPNWKFKRVKVYIGSNSKIPTLV